MTLELQCVLNALHTSKHDEHNLPIHFISSTMKTEHATITETELDDEFLCTICCIGDENDKIDVNTAVIILPCRHVFCYYPTNKCSGIYKWFNENNTCPNCRERFSVARAKLSDIIVSQLQYNSLVLD